MKHPTKTHRFYLSKALPLRNKKYGEVKKEAIAIIKKYEEKTKRKPHLKSKYFKRKKVFLHLFLKHLFEKNPKERAKRLRYLPCAIELIEKSTCNPVIKIDAYKGKQFYRFFGRTKNKERFAVQIKESNNGAKYFMSVFEWKR